MSASKQVNVAGASSSLWNFSLNPGWTKEEVAVLKLGVKKYGMGCWKRIDQAQILPGKTISQMYLQTQKLVGQQSLGGFVGVHLDVDEVRAANEARTDVTKKNGLIINSGANPTAETRRAEILQNQERFGIPKEVYEAINIIPIVEPVEHLVIVHHGQEVVLDTKEKEETWESISKVRHGLKLLYKQLERLNWEKERGLTPETRYSVPDELSALWKELNRLKSGSMGAVKGKGKGKAKRVLDLEDGGDLAGDDGLELPLDSSKTTQKKRKTLKLGTK